MKRLLGLVPLLLVVTLCNAQYSKEKLTDILTGGSAKVWTVKSSSAPEKTFSFNKNQTVEITKSSSAQKEQWLLTSNDNIRWFITIGSKKQELIVSYDKAGAQFVKLTTPAGDKSSIYSELILYPK